MEPRRTARDPRSGRPFDAGVLEAVDGWGAQTAARRGRRRRRPGGVAAGRWTRAALGLGHEAASTACVVLVGRAARRRWRSTTPAGPPGSTIRHLLAHAGGYGFDGGRPGGTRADADLLERGVRRAGRGRWRPPPGGRSRSCCAAWVLEPLAMGGTRLDGRPSRGPRRAGRGPGGVRARAAGAARSCRRGCSPRRRPSRFPGCAACCRGSGSRTPTTGGSGFEIRDGKSPHWTGVANSPATFGHFGRSGTFLWVDPVAGLALACLTDRPFGAWAGEAWPAISDAVLAAMSVG